MTAWRSGLQHCSSRHAPHWLSRATAPCAPPIRSQLSRPPSGAQSQPSMPARTPILALNSADPVVAPLCLGHALTIPFLPPNHSGSIPVSNWQVFIFRLGLSVSVSKIVDIYNCTVARLCNIECSPMFHQSSSKLESLCSSRRIACGPAPSHEPSHHTTLLYCGQQRYSHP